jgi:glycosyltransferase involved in cell wall biosynthesis
MIAQPLITVFTSSYNHEKYLDEYFHGLLAQTYKNVQLIIVDDNSSDQSWEKIRSYEGKLKAQFSSVLIERHENIGPSRELIRLLDQVKGDIFCLLQSDDYYLPEMLEEHVRYLRSHPEVGAVHSEVDYIYGRRIERRHWQTIGKPIPSGEIFEALLLDNFIMCCSFSCRTELFRKHVRLEDHLAKGYVAGDYAIFLDLARHTKFGYINKSLARYRVLQDSQIHSTDLQRAFEIEKNYQQIKLDYIEKYGASDKARSLAIEGKHQADFIYGFKMNQPDQCLQAYEWLMQNNPARYKALPFRVLALSVRNRYLWKVVSLFESMRVVQDLALAGFRLRHRGMDQTQV